MAPKNQPNTPRESPAPKRRRTQKQTTPPTPPAAPEKIETAPPPPKRERMRRPKRTPHEHLRALMVASEAHPFAKTGGLAEVLGALPAALARLGHDVIVVLPKYRGVDDSGGIRIPHTFQLGDT